MVDRAQAGHEVLWRAALLSGRSISSRNEEHVSEPGCLCMNWGFEVDGGAATVW